MSSELIQLYNREHDNPYTGLDSEEKRSVVFGKLINFIEKGGFPTDFTNTTYCNIHWKVLRHYFRLYPETFDIDRLQVAIAHARNKFREDSQRLMRNPKSKAILPIWSKLADKYMAIRFKDDKKEEKLGNTIDAMMIELSKISNKEIPSQLKNSAKGVDLLAIDNVLDSIDAVF